MRLLLLLIAFSAVFAAGCSMAAPGVARIQAAPPPGAPVAPAALAGDPSWANPRTEEATLTPAAATEEGFGTDFSKRELGVHYFGADDKIKPGEKRRYASAAEQRQAERRDARRKAIAEENKLGSSNPAKQ